MPSLNKMKKEEKHFFAHLLFPDCHEETDVELRWKENRGSFFFALTFLHWWYSNQDAIKGMLILKINIDLLKGFIRKTWWKRKISDCFFVLTEQKKIANLPEQEFELKSLKWWQFTLQCSWAKFCSKYLICVKNLHILGRIVTLADVELRWKVNRSCFFCYSCFAETFVARDK